jgi:hypothetical protein
MVPAPFLQQPLCVSTSHPTARFTRCSQGSLKLACNNHKHFVSRKSHTNYKAASANLKLITIIKCVSVDNTLDLGFVFPGKEFCSEWFEIPNIM